ncbi:hypothetical protein M6D93_02170 [Jatrophihabitans telluris]|uniref:Restriction endonuclease subunit M n=1 Tax=Jatrophihabitans telluris TaxID=2038343 RepID=A0ABY4QZ16_9ACTN|nr:hypothetical protein [Jatrophihabitans telluris]UQX88819.1 hypothetical protein M6D93_02170 [Jatrophihabitans telluris]
MSRVYVAASANAAYEDGIEDDADSSPSAMPSQRPVIAVRGPNRVDVDEASLADSAPGVLELLLADMATGSNIIWATQDYAHLGSAFNADQAITVASITGPHAGLICPRVAKSKARQGDRAKNKAEVFTPSWLCNEQNNLVDEAWFGRTGVFNTTTGRVWRAASGLIEFETTGSRTWQCYVDEPRLESACGEAPYLASRYDATTGVPIALERRIGLLDRKVRVVTERSQNEAEWLHWALRAFQSVYGFEFHGDSLLLARENLLTSYVDYARHALARQPTTDELTNIAEVIAWNIWQMDALTGRIPFKAAGSGMSEMTLFDLHEADNSPCRIRDWRANETIEFRSLLKERGAR